MKDCYIERVMDKRKSFQMVVDVLSKYPATASSSSSSAPYGHTTAEETIDDAQELCARLKSSLSSMAESNVIIETGLNELDNTPDTQKRDKLVEMIDRSLQTSEKCAKEVTQGIKQLQGLSDAGDKLASSQRAFLTRKLSAQVSALWKMRDRFSKQRSVDMRDRVQSNFLVRTGNVLPTDVADALLATGDVGRDQKMRDSVGHNMTHLQILLEIAEETQREVLKIQREIEGLEQIFRDCQLLVMEQGDMLDDILTEAQRANRNITAGTKELDKAIQYHKAAKKKHGWIICGVVVILIIVGVAVGVPVYIVNRA